jgi:hypothetical protein
MLSVFAPVANSTKDKLTLWDSTPNSLQNVIQTLCQNPSYKMLQLRNIPQCDSKVSAFNADLWEGMVQRMRQLLITNSSEHKINWNITAESHKHKIIKSISNLVILRGDKVYDERP